MRKHALDLAILFVLSTLVTAYLALARPEYRSIQLHAYVLVVGALTMLGIVFATTDAVPRRTGTELDRALDARGTRDRPVPALERVTREVTLSSATAYDFHIRLLPHLCAVAAARLERRGHELGADTAGSAWELLRPDRPPPDDRFAPGIPPADLRRLVEELERM